MGSLTKVKCNFIQKNQIVPGNFSCEAEITDYEYPAY